MEFLRRLSPSRLSDASRALPVLPSRFEQPRSLLANDPAPVGSTPGTETDISPGSETQSVRPVQAVGATTVDIRLPLSHASTRSVSQQENVARSKVVLAAPASIVPGGVRAQPYPVLQTPLGNTLPAERTTTVPATRQMHAPILMPLSAAAVAERATSTHDGESVVHVTIGRIDVVANTQPPSTSKRIPVSRGASVPLSDYLRGEKRGRS